ncbi:unnamed protein product, partial [Timema podura]|nr:unnamed protein product [Timema podura]
FSIDRNKVLVVSGEQTRHRSIRAGLRALHKKESPVHVVVVHDAVRPIVPAGLVEELVLAADQHGAAGFTRPLVSTVVQGGEDGFLERTLDRATHFASETPQAFQFNILMSAFSKDVEGSKKVLYSQVRKRRREKRQRIRMVNEEGRTLKTGELGKEL